MNGPKTDAHDPLDDARQLIDRLLDDELAAEDAARLERMVCERPDVRRFYVLSMHLWCNLAPHMTAAATGDGADEPAPALDFEESMVLPALTGAEEPGEPEPIELPPLVWPQPGERSPWRRRWHGVAALAASVLIAATVALVWPRKGNVATTPPAPPAPRQQVVEAPPEVVVPPRPVTTAALAGALNAEWAAPHASIRPGQALPAGLLHLKKGLAEVRFANDVSMILEGPARIDIRSDTRTHLLAGKLVATVPDATSGFVVRTGAAEVVDLGTEFGVEVDAGGATRVEVFRGKVRADAPAAGGDGLAPARASAFESRELVAGEAGRVAPGATTVKALPAAPLSFVRGEEFEIRQASAAGSDYHRWLAHTYQVRRDPSLAAYYTFDRPAGNAPAGVLPNRAAAAAAGADGSRFALPLGYRGNTATLPAWVEGRWPSKGALDFNAAARHGMHLPQFPFARNGRLTVAAWVKARSLTYWGAIAKNRGDTPDAQGQFSLGLYGNEGSLVGRVTQPDGVEVLVREPATSPMPVGRWVHVALVADGTMLRLYRDGREVAAAPCAGPTPDPNPEALTVGYRAGADGTPNAGNRGEHWDGLIDEVAIFHRDLAAREIQELYEAGKPGN